MLAQVDDPPPSPRKLNDSINPDLERVILRALAKDPRDRFQTAGEFREALLAEADARFQLSLHGPPQPNPPAEPMPSAPAPPEPEAQPVSAVFEPSASAAVFDEESGDLSRMLGIALACFSAAVLVFLGGMILIGP